MRKTLFVLVVLICFTLVGCASTDNSDYDSEYAAGYDAGYADAVSDKGENTQAETTATVEPGGGKVDSNSNQQDDTSKMEPEPSSYLCKSADGVLEAIWAIANFDKTYEYVDVPKIPNAIDDGAGFIAYPTDHILLGCYYGEYGELTDVWFEIDDRSLKDNSLGTNEYDMIEQIYFEAYIYGFLKYCTPNCDEIAEQINLFGFGDEVATYECDSNGVTYNLTVSDLSQIDFTAYPTKTVNN